MPETVDVFYSMLMTKNFSPLMTQGLQLKDGRPVLHYKKNSRATFQPPSSKKTPQTNISLLA